MSGGVEKTSAGSNFNPETMIFVYVHIPKTGGTSLHAALNEVFPGRYVQLGGNNTLYDLNEVHAIGGHFGFESERLKACERRRVYATALRHPYDRFVSSYRHILGDSSHYLSIAHPNLRLKDPLAFAKFLVDLGNTEISNLQCKLICGTKRPSASEAIFNLQHYYSFVETNHHQQSLLASIASFANRPVPKPRRLNVSSDYYQVVQDDKLYSYICEINQEDLKMYNWLLEHTDKLPSLVKPRRLRNTLSRVRSLLWRQ